MIKRAALCVALGAALPFAFAARARASGLDVTTDYRMRSLSYTNLNLVGVRNNRSFMSQNARLGVAVRDIHLQSARGEDVTMDVAILLHAVGVAGSTTSLQAPFDRIGASYPNSTFIPFIENAYVKTRGLFGWPLEWTFGQQPFTLGSGLILADDGAGLAGISGRGSLPFWEMKGVVFAFQGRNNQGTADSLMVFGGALELPTEGAWQLSETIERDRAPGMAAGLPVSRAVRSFTSVHYEISFGPLFFEGEAAIERGAATPTGLTPAPNHVTYNGNAQVLRAKWKQPFYRGEEGIARVVVSRGSGDSAGSATTDEAFFPSRGHRYDGLERAGFGELFGATPYDALGGRSTANGLAAGASGIQTVGLGLTPPAYHGFVLDFDYFLYQADRNIGSHRSLGAEYDIKARFPIRDRFSLSASAAFFKVGPASNEGKGSARRLLFEASARF